LGQKEEIAGQNVQTDEVGFDQYFWREAELDGVEFEQAEDMLIEWRQGQLLALSSKPKPKILSFRTGLKAR